MKLVQISLAIFLILFFVNRKIQAETIPQEKPGILNAQHYDFANQRLPLSGYWIFYANQLLSLEQCKAQRGDFIAVPRVWNEINPTGKGTGYGTYYLKIVLPPQIRNWSIEMPQVYNSYELWIDGLPIAKNGQVGTSAKNTIPQWRPQTASFKTENDTVHLVLQVANFHHFTGGLREPLYLGSKESLSQYDTTALISVFAECILLLLTFFIFFILYITHPHKSITLHFSLLCFTWAIRVLFSNLYPITIFFPDFNWTFMVRIEYITLYLTMIFATAFINRLFKEVSSKTFWYVMLTINVAFIAFTLFTPPILFTRWLSLYLSACALSLLYVFVAVIRALIMEKSGSIFLVSGVLLGILLMGYDLLAYKGLIFNSTLILSVGYIIIFMLISIALLLHLGIIKGNLARSSTLTYKDLYKPVQKSNTNKK